MSSLTRLQRTNGQGFPKPGELIEITRAHQLEASDRAILNLLYQHAHDSGLLTEDDVEWEIPMSALRVSRHKGSERVSDSLDRLMSVVVSVPLLNAKTGEPRILKTNLFSFVDLSADETSERATVRFGLPPKLRPVLAISSRWGRIRAEVVCAMTSKYAIALYELVQLRARMDRCVETFPLARFRELMGVPPKTYDRGNDFIKRVIEPATLEVNALSDWGVDISLDRRNMVTPIKSVTVTWWEKPKAEIARTRAEISQPKAGRAARLRGTVKKMKPQPLRPPAPPASRAAAILAELDARGANDIEYRVAFSTFSKVALRKGETWRGRLVAYVAKHGGDCSGQQGIVNALKQGTAAD